MTLPGPARAEFDHVVIPLNKRHHPKQRHPLSALVEMGRLQTNRTNQKGPPFSRRKTRASSRQHIQHVWLRHLDRSERPDAKWHSLVLLRKHGVVFERDLGIE